MRMKVFPVILFLYFVFLSNGKSIKKFKDETFILTKKLINKPKPSTPPAVIAIEIVDPLEEKKNSKRTIDSSLGYGYQQPPKYEVYKYSQHDIPAYRGAPNIFSQGIKSHNFDIQKSISYNLPTQSLNKYYQPGQTYYSTVNNQGQAEGLSSHSPNDPHVPVIILKVYPNQLNDPSASLHPNLPHSHPLASVVNSIDVQALLSKYVQNLRAQQYQPEQYQYQQEQYQHQPQQEQYQYQQQPEQYQQQQDQYQYQQQPEQYQYQELPQGYQYEQYQQQPPQYQQQQYQYQQQEDPKHSHTKVIYHKDDHQQSTNESPNVVYHKNPEQSEESKTIRIEVPDGAYSSVQVETPEMQYGYMNSDNGALQQYYYQADGQNYEYQQPPNEEQTRKQEKRSKKFARSRQEQDDNVIKLKPIRA